MQRSGEFLALCVVAAVILAGSAHAFECVEKYCTKMSSCAEAHYHFTVCHESQRDADNDGIPCENVCGKTLDEYRRLLGSDAERYTPNVAPEAPPGPAPEHSTGEMQHGETLPAATFQCAGKHRCGDMSSCEQARFYLTTCGVRSLDRDGDGVPCESLCGGG